MDHSDRDCEIWLESEGSLAETQKQFGPSLRAPPFFPSKRSVVAVPGFYSQKRSTTKPYVTETGLEERGETSEGLQAVEEITVAQKLGSSDSTFNAHSGEKTDTINEPIYSGNGYVEDQIQQPNISPHNPDRFNAENSGSNYHGMSGDSCPLCPTDSIGIIPINNPIKCSKYAESLEAAHPYPNAHTSIPNSMSRENHEVTRATKKIGTWTRLDRSKITQQVAQADPIGSCKRKFSTIDDHSELPCNKKQVLKDDDDFSSEMVEAVD